MGIGLESKGPSMHQADIWSADAQPIRIERNAYPRQHRPIMRNKATPNLCHRALGMEGLYGMAAFLPRSKLWTPFYFCSQTSIMTDKCWFVLRHQHYPPPKFPINGAGTVEGPICPGHLIPDLQHLDNVINTKGPEEFPPDMPIHKRTTQEFLRSTESGGDLTVSAGANVPVVAAIGVDINLSTEKTFQKSVSNSWRFAALDTFIVQVTPAYIEDSLDAPEVIQYTRKHKLLGITRSLFMITGLMIARGAKSSSLKHRTTGGGAEVGR